MIPAADNQGRRSSVAAMLTAGVLMAHQVGAKAARDAIFLSNYDAAALPAMMAGAAASAVVLGVVASKLLSRHAPSRLVPWAFAASAALQVGEWRLMSAEPRLAAVLIYLHLAAFGAVLLSGFWSVTNETLDPHTAKRRFGQIAAAGTVGGLGGGLVAASLGTGNVLVWLAGLHIAGAGALAAMREISPRRAAGAPEPAPAGTARQAFSKAPYLYSLAALVLVTTAAAAAIDWVFKAQSAAFFADGERLMRFLALYHSAIQVFNLAMQTFVTRASLEKLGLGRTVGMLPAAVAAGGAGALFFPAFPVIAALRGSESVLHGSLFRSGYEVFYTPIPVAEKRSAKSIIDVGVDRLGDALGAGVTNLFLLLGAAAAPNRILLAAAALSAAGVWLARRLDRGYIQALEASLVNRAVEVDPAAVPGSAIRPAAPRAAGQAPGAGRTPANVNPAKVVSAAPRPARPLEPVVQRLADLRSGRAPRVRAALSAAELPGPPLDRLLGAQIISLLAWDEVYEAARDALTAAAPRLCGQLIDFLLDESEDFAIRRRIPRVLAACANERAAAGLTAALADSRFEVRFQSARALAGMLEKHPELRADPTAVFAAINRELSVSRSVWEGHRLLDRRDPTEQTQFLDEVLRERAHASLEHVFTLLALVLPREPLQVAFRALHTDDSLLRGLALEYLETVLPEGIREKLSLIVERPEPARRRTGEEILASLMQSNESVIALLRERLPQT